MANKPTYEELEQRVKKLEKEGKYIKSVLPWDDEPGFNLVYELKIPKHILKLRKLGRKKWKQSKSL